jgi:hypothetical protein
MVNFVNYPSLFNINVDKVMSIKYIGVWTKYKGR